MDSPRLANLAQWLAWQETLHPRAIDLGLDRVRWVLRRLGLEPPPYQVITVGGTNGKGSTVAFLEAMLCAAGFRVGAYTSPHLLHYKERVRLNGVEVSNGALCRAFSRIDSVRDSQSLTYFEFGTLAALHIFREAAIQVAVLEVGLGGRLDAVNVVDADGMVVTSVAIDHVEWLGPDRESIGREKAGIFRCGRPAVCADPDPPSSLLDRADAIGAPLYRIGQHYGFERFEHDWSWWSRDSVLECLPLPALVGEHQLANAAASLMVLNALSGSLTVAVGAIRSGLSRAFVPARFQVISGPVEWILDVAHNPHGVAALARCLASRPCAGRTRAVVGMLNDKDATAMAHALQIHVDLWYTAGLDGPRGRTGQQLAEVLRAELPPGHPVRGYSSVGEACRAARDEASLSDRIVVFGSFLTVAQALRAADLLADDTWTLPQSLRR